MWNDLSVDRRQRNTSCVHLLIYICINFMTTYTALDTWLSKQNCWSATYKFWTGAPPNLITLFDIIVVNLCVIYHSKCQLRARGNDYMQCDIVFSLLTDACLALFDKWTLCLYTSFSPVSSQHHIIISKSKTISGFDSVEREFIISSCIVHVVYIAYCCIVLALYFILLFSLL